MGKFKIYPLECGSATRSSERVGLHFNPGVPYTYPILAFYLTDGEHKILIDAGGPEKVCEAKMPYSQTPDQHILKQLEKINVSPDEIELVIITHLHWDHTWNLALFKNAEFIVQKRELEYSVTPVPVHRLTYCHWWRLYKTNYTIVEGDTEIMDGLSVMLTPGHTPGSQSVVIDTEAGTFVYISDLANLDEHWEKKIPSGVICSITDTFDSFKKVQRVADYVLTGHEPEAVKHPVYPNPEFPRKQTRTLIYHHYEPCEGCSI